jgi:hypothetical protein
MYRIASRSFLNRIDRDQQQTIQSIATDLTRLKAKEETLDFSVIQHACSSIYANNGSVGSGAFITLDNNYTSGYFLTAAHCVQESNSYTKIGEMYITNPIDNTWFKIDNDKIYIDGVADIALIETLIDFTNHKEYCLQLSNMSPLSGDVCFVCGNPGGFDNDSITKGVVRDNHYALTSGAYVPDAIHVNAPGKSGNSGSPILNKHGNVIGIYVFGAITPIASGVYQELETFNGGPNLSTLMISLNTLKKKEDNKTKKYLGINWQSKTPFYIKDYYPSSTTFPNQGFVITKKNNDSPFTTLQVNDLILSYTINNVKTGVGVVPSQRTLGQLIYSKSNVISIEYIRNSDKTKITENVTIDKTYETVPDNYDLMLVGGAPS